jgi:hypothetical protein
MPIFNGFNEVAKFVIVGGALGNRGAPKTPLEMCW